SARCPRIRSTRRATPRSAVRPARARPARARPHAPAAGGGSRTRPRSAASTAPSRPAAWSTSCTRSSATTTMTDLKADEQEVARGEAQAVLAVAADPDYRNELASLVVAADEGSLDEDEERTLERVLELGLQAGRIRAVYGPGGEQAALRL